MYWFTIVISALAILSAQISPENVPFSTWLTLALPAVVLLQSGLATWWIFNRKWQKAIPSILMLTYGAHFINAFVGTGVPSTKKTDLSVLSYNVQVFNVYKHLNNDFQESEAILQFLENDQSDIKCFQEFYNQDRNGKNQPEGLFRTIERLQKNGYNAHAVPITTNHMGDQFGLAIFSRFPITNTGKIQLPYTKGTSNGAIYADVQIGKETVRIINTHLHSMVFSEDRNIQHAGIFMKAWRMLTKYRKSQSRRAEQVNILYKFIQESPYRTILCGDFNDTPFSYPYQRIRSILKNAFEEKGIGLGFTLNHSKLFFLRLDNQFYSKGLQTNNFNTLQVPYSDHFPIKGNYRLVNR
ncbi:endonuclease/exonuclease/phosphatase family protein [Limibacter armeniacum]|uniref:endonuclease/exonuclease/phosphatase family protein n=1 Tax=Limibacter armeniacum TaxID=466084 RepID=UPI002FE69099